MAKRKQRTMAVSTSAMTVWGSPEGRKSMRSSFVRLRLQSFLGSGFGVSGSGFRVQGLEIRNKSQAAKIALLQGKPHGGLRPPKIDPQTVGCPCNQGPNKAPLTFVNPKF